MTTHTTTNEKYPLPLSNLSDLLPLIWGNNTTIALMLLKREVKIHLKTVRVRI